MRAAPRIITNGETRLATDESCAWDPLPMRLSVQARHRAVPLLVTSFDVTRLDAKRQANAGKCKPWASAGVARFTPGCQPRVDSSTFRQRWGRRGCLRPRLARKIVRRPNRWRRNLFEPNAGCDCEIPRAAPCILFIRHFACNMLPGTKRPTVGSRRNAGMQSNDRMGSHRTSRWRSTRIVVLFPDSC